MISCRLSKCVMSYKEFIYPQFVFLQWIYNSHISIKKAPPALLASSCVIPNFKLSVLVLLLVDILHCFDSEIWSLEKKLKKKIMYGRQPHFFTSKTFGLHLIWQLDHYHRHLSFYFFPLLFRGHNSNKQDAFSKNPEDFM